MIHVCAALTLSYALLLPHATAEGRAPIHAVPAERLILKYTNGEFQVLSRSFVRKVIPPPSSLPRGHERLRGFWYEVRSPTGDVRYSRIFSDPTRLVYESVDPTSKNDVRLERVEVMLPERVFSVVVPRGGSGDRLHFFGEPPHSLPGAASRELFSAPVTAK
jgi:hypothetical protein